MSAWLIKFYHLKSDRSQIIRRKWIDSFQSSNSRCLRPGRGHGIPPFPGGLAAEWRQRGEALLHEQGTPESHLEDAEVQRRWGIDLILPNILNCSVIWLLTFKLVSKFQNSLVELLECHFLHSSIAFYAIVLARHSDPWNGNTRLLLWFEDFTCLTRSQVLSIRFQCEITTWNSKWYNIFKFPSLY